MPTVKQRVNSSFKTFLFQYCKQFSNVAWLDSHVEVHSKGDKAVVVALGKKSDFLLNTSGDLKAFQSYSEQGKHLFGFISYDLKNEIDTTLKSNNHDGLGFPELYFFEPEILIELNDDEVTITCEDIAVINSIFTQQLPSECLFPLTGFNVNTFRPRLSKEEYFNKVTQIKEKIAKGDLYEMNFCYEFFVENSVVNPFDVYEQLADFSPTPFSSFFRKDEQYIMCASPERFIKKTGNKIISQPIKGTAKRGETPEEDEQMKQQLLNSSKERSENVMIVDLVRNDLAQIAKDASVQVDELFGIYTFPQVHQMISTISCELKADTSLVEILAKCFPMGSMTGAPKISAMKLIEEFENSKRGVYSGSIGYITPEGDFDFNVVIRSLLYNKANEYLSFSVGSAITYHSIPEEEYEETLLKAKAIFKVFT